MEPSRASVLAYKVNDSQDPCLLGYGEAEMGQPREDHRAGSCAS